MRICTRLAAEDRLYVIGLLRTKSLLTSYLQSAPIVTRNHLRTSQSQSISLAFDLLAPFDLSSHTGNVSLEHIILQPLSIWCTYLSFNFDLLAQIYALARRGEVSAEGRGSSAGGAGREREAESEAAREVLSRLMAFLRGLATRINEDDDGGSDSAADDRVAACPLPEDVELLGLMPLRRFHAGVVLLKEAGTGEGDEGTEGENERRVRIARIRACLRKFADVEVCCRRAIVLKMVSNSVSLNYAAFYRLSILFGIMMLKISLLSLMKKPR